MDSGATHSPNGRPGGSTGRTEHLREEAERFQRKNPHSRPKWQQYRTEEQQRIIDDAAIFRRNLRSQAKRLGFTGPDAITKMRDAWLPNALEIMRMDDAIAISMGKVLERIAVALEKMAQNGAARAAIMGATVPAEWKCPVHGKGTLRPAGISRNGKAYNAFWTCNTQMPDGTWCAERPLARAYTTSEASTNEANTNDVRTNDVTTDVLP